MWRGLPLINDKSPPDGAPVPSVLDSVGVSKLDILVSIASQASGPVSRSMSIEPPQSRHVCADTTGLVTGPSGEITQMIRGLSGFFAFPSASTFGGKLSGWTGPPDFTVPGGAPGTGLSTQNLLEFPRSSSETYVTSQSGTSPAWRDFRGCVTLSRNCEW